MTVMKRIVVLTVAAAACAAASLYAVQTPAVHPTAPTTATYHPGDTVWIDVNFAQPADISTGDLFFQLLGQPRTDQQGLEFRFGGKSGQVQKVSDTDYRIGEKIPRGIASGQYRLYRVQVRLANMFRGYELGSAFYNQLVIRVLSKQVTAPPSIQSLKLIPPKQK